MTNKPNKKEIATGLFEYLGEYSKYFTVQEIERILDYSSTNTMITFITIYLSLVVKINGLNLQFLGNQFNDDINNSLGAVILNIQKIAEDNPGYRGIYSITVTYTYSSNYINDNNKNLSNISKIKDALYISMVDLKDKVEEAFDSLYDIYDLYGFNMSPTSGSVITAEEVFQDSQDNKDSFVTKYFEIDYILINENTFEIIDEWIIDDNTIKEVSIDNGN